MNEITKEEITTMLILDFYIKKFIGVGVLNEKRGSILQSIYDNNLSDGELDDISKQYYDVLKTTFAMDRYSLVVDYLLNRNKNITENDIVDFKKFINIKKDTSHSKNIDIAKKIRYAYNHNDDLTNNKFKVYDNSSYEVNVDNSDFIADFNFDDVIKMTNYLSENTRNKHYLYVEGCFDFDLSKDLDKQIDNIHVIYYPLKNNFPKSAIDSNLSNKILDRSSREQVCIASDNNRSILKAQLQQEIEDSGGTFNEDDYKYWLDQYQKEKLKDIILRLKTIDSTIPFKENVSLYMTYAVQCVLPIPYTHFIWFDDVLCALSEFTDLKYSHEYIVNRSYDRLVNEIKKLELDKKSNKNIDSRILLSELRYFLFIRNVQEVIKYAQINIIKYLITNHIKDDHICVGNKTHDVKRIRNSLVHYRRFSGLGNDVVFYDALPNHEKVYDFKFCQKIDIDSLLEECRKIYNKRFSS